MDKESNEILKKVLREIVSRPKCAECRQPLTHIEVDEAISEGVKNPICNDCYNDYLINTRPPYPDEDSFYKRRGICR